MSELINGRYQLLDKLGQGGFGSVWRAFDQNLNREVAVKLLNLANENQEEMVARFKTESRVASSFEHQNILRVYDFGQDETGRCFLISELLKGISLHDKLKPKEPLPLPLALDILYQVGSALEVAHEQKTVHRDIKPPNIFLNQPMKGPGFVKLLDFGIAKVMGGNKQESLTVTGQIMGTPHYMSPEQIVNIKLVDHRSDIYSLGIVFYQMLTGVVPFDDESYFAIMKHQMQSPMPKIMLPQCSTQLQDELQGILKAMTHKDVRKRTANIKEILIQIEQIWQSNAGAMSPQSTTGSFRAISLDPLSVSPSPSNGLNVSDNLLADFSSDAADAIIDDFVEAAHHIEEQDTELPEDQADQELDDIPPTQISISSASNEILSATPIKTDDEVDHSSVAVSEVQATKDELKTATVASTTTFEPIGLHHKPRPHLPIVASIVVLLLIVGFISWSQRSANTDQQVNNQVALSQQNSQTIKREKLPNIPQVDQVVRSPDQAVANLKSSTPTLLQDSTVSTEIDSSVPVDMNILDAKVEVEPVPDAEVNVPPTPNETQEQQKTVKKKTQTKKKTLSNNKKRRKTKKRKKKAKKKIKAKLRLSPKSIAYELNQEVKLIFSSKIGSTKGKVSLCSQAKWVSISKQKIKLIGLGTCRLKVCYGKECSKPYVIHIEKPMEF